MRVWLVYIYFLILSGVGLIVFRYLWCVCIQVRIGKGDYLFSFHTSLSPNNSLRSESLPPPQCLALVAEPNQLFEGESTYPSVPRKVGGKLRSIRDGKISKASS